MPSKPLFQRIIIIELISKIINRDSNTKAKFCFKVTVSASGYEPTRKLVTISELHVSPQQVIFRLVKNNKIIGMPRLLFTGLSGNVIVIDVSF